MDVIDSIDKDYPENVSFILSQSVDNTTKTKNEKNTNNSLFSFISDKNIRFIRKERNFVYIRHK